MLKVFILAIFSSSFLAMNPPYLKLEAMLEDPAGQGWGIIAPGYPDIDYNNLRSVPLEEEGRGDMNQVFDPRTGFIEFLHFNGDGHCITAQSSEPGAAVDAPICNKYNSLQHWYQEGEGSIHLLDFSWLCLTVGEDLMDFGDGSFYRELRVSVCAEVEREYKIWEIVE